METFKTCLLKNNSKSAGEKALSLLVRVAGLATVLILALVAGGCLVSNDEFDKARLQRDEYLRESQAIHQANDALKREISEIYESCDLISTQLTVLAAMSIHDQYTAGLARPRPVLPPPITTRTPTATAPTQTRRPAPNQGGATTRRPSGDTQNAGTGTGGTRRPPSGGQGGRTGGGNSPAPQPAPSPGGGGGGSIDWGF